MKKFIPILLTALLCISLFSCDGGKHSKDTYTPAPETTQVFSNKFGTPTTVCAVQGCSNYISQVGDTNCCFVHSDMCSVCGCLIDGGTTICYACNENSDKNPEETTRGAETTTEEAEKPSEGATESDSKPSSSEGSGDTSSSSFTNKYGTPTTKCVKSGCNNYIAKSGDSNCCTTHSNRCLECNCYIDGDAMYCMSCLTGGSGHHEEPNHNSGGSSSNSFTNKYGTPTTKCVKSGCNNYIAKSGDSNCCTTHSNRCLECNCYIDGDAMYCMSCLTGGSGHHDEPNHNSGGSSSSSFTNRYGTPTTKCVKSGCNNYIAKSGDSNCCTTHSNRCLECNCYIDGDAMYCMSCLTGGLY